jgi:membrane fusion protein (multidrug efflux system)
MSTTEIKQSRVAEVVRKSWRPVVGVAGLAVLVIWSAGSCESKVAPGKVEAPAGLAVPAGAATYTVVVERAAARVDVVGTAASEQRIALSARLSATIQSMAVSAGDRVTNGQVLATLDDRDVREQVVAAEAQFKQAESEFQRTKQLFGKGASTEQALQAAQALYDAARARLEQVRVLQSYTVITSPINGVVTDRRMEAGDLVGPGQVIAFVYDPTRMRLEVPVPVRLVSRFALNQALDVTLDGFAEPLKGTVGEVVSEVDPLSRTQKVKVRIGPMPRPVLPGTFGRIWVETEPRDRVQVPASSVYRAGQQEFVQTVVDGRALRRVVKTAGEAGPGQVEVIAGLSAGDAVLLNPVRED